MADTKGWSYKAGEKGRNRVRTFEDHKTGVLQLEYYERAPDGLEPKRRRFSLEHRDRERAKRQADAVAADLAAGLEPERTQLTLEELFDIYVAEVTPGKSLQKQKHDRRCVGLFLACFGASRRAHTLNRRDWDRFIRDRRSGELRPKGKAKAKPVGDRQVAYDLSWLRAVLNWAASARNTAGEPLLDRNPLSGLPLPRELNPARPVLSEARYRAMLAVAGGVDWRCELGLVLAHETGHRIGSIRKLQWFEIDLEEGLVRWRAEHDKLGRAHTTPLPGAATLALKKAKLRGSEARSAWVLPAPRDPEKPCSRHLLRTWWLRMEERAGLPHLKGMGWHSLRRKFASEFIDLPPKDLCQLGGWQSYLTVQTCYQRSDQVRLRRALERRTTFQGDEAFANRR